jgi:hypothetical protein
MRGIHRRCLLAIIMVIGMVAATSSQALADEESLVGLDTFKLEAGVFLPAIDSNLKIKSKSIGEGTGIDLENDLGFDDTISIGRTCGVRS